jgi:hypothetical protein
MWATRNNLHHQRHVEQLQGRRQRRVSLGLVVESLGIELGAQHRGIDMRLGHVYAHHH